MANDGQFKDKHGGAGAVKAIRRNTDFRGLAAGHETEVRAELQAEGRASIVERNAIRLQTAADLYFEAVIKAFQDGELDRADSYIRQYGWLAGAALRAWAQLKGESREKPEDVQAVISLYREDGGQDA